MVFITTLALTINYKFQIASVLLVIVILVFDKEIIFVFGATNNGNEPNYIITSNIIALLGTFGGLGGIFWGIYTYRSGQILKKHEILFPLIKEFDDSYKMRIAKDLLDGYTAYKTNSKWLHEESYYQKSNLSTILRDHSLPLQDIREPGEIEIRKSFDAFLDFFCKLEYLLNIKLLTRKEIEYFDYYIEKATENKAVLDYIRYYKFPLYGNLHRNLKQP